LLAQINHINPAKLKPGMVINIPSLKPQYISMIKNIHQIQPINPKSYKVIHIVQPHENMDIIAQKYQTTIAFIKSWNPQISENLSTGDKLTIWRQTNGKTFYIVKLGDSFNQIAKMHHISPMYLSRLNPHIRTQYLNPGMKIKVC
jgi:LysM repeat protein